jgi:hypothetical protein
MSPTAARIQSYSGVANSVRAALVALAVCCVAGCTDASAPPLIPKATAETPEAKLELVMDRLQTAIVDAAAASGSGVVSQRKIDHRLIAPDKAGGQYKAEVTIETRLALAKAPAAVTLSPSDDEESEEGDEVLTEEDEETPEIGADNGVTTRAIEQSRDVQTRVYELGYDGNRWTLLTKPKPDDEVAKYLFEYALAD